MKISKRKERTVKNKKRMYCDPKRIRKRRRQEEEMYVTSYDHKIFIYEFMIIVLEKKGI